MCGSSVCEAAIPRRWADRTLEGGTATSDCVTRPTPSGWRLAGFHGSAGSEVDKLGFIYTAR
jgi:hypothetical protein